jgi:MoaA/NifB/PqqE/SkfB family radical SAM enzyme
MAELLAEAACNAPVLISPAGNLTSIDVYITAQCNRRCTYCFLSPDFLTSGQRMSLDSFAGIVTWGRRQGVGEITLLGGEPSLHPSFADMVSMAARYLDVRVVTNGARRFRRLLEDGSVGPQNLARVAVSLDTLDDVVQDRLRGPGACRDAKATIELLQKCNVRFDVNVTAVTPVLDGLEALIDFADQAGCRRVNVHWPSTMGIGSSLGADQVPDRSSWEYVVGRIRSRVERRADFFVEIERGFLAEDELLTGCALTEFSNLQIFPDGRAYRCGLLVDQAEMASLSMVGGQLRLTRPDRGEELLRAMMPGSCDGCPVLLPDRRRACIYDKVSSGLHGPPSRP